MDCLECGEELQLPNEFISYTKIPRLSRECLITEKIDGTNAQIYIKYGKIVGVGSKNRWITSENDNFGFARWVKQHDAEILGLGDGRHYGEWWGVGIQRGYDLSERRFTLFRAPKYGELPYPLIKLVPILYEGLFTTQVAESVISNLAFTGSHAVPGYMKPEGIVIFHKASGQLFKKTIEHDEESKEAHERRIKHEEKLNVTSTDSTIDTGDKAVVGSNTESHS